LFVTTVGGWHGFFSCYEAFVHIVDSLLSSHV
jgi:phosphoketolase